MRFIIDSVKSFKSLQSLDGIVGGANNIRCIVKEENSPRNDNGSVYELPIGKTITLTKKHGIVETEEVELGALIVAPIVTGAVHGEQRNRELASALNEEFGRLETEPDEVPEYIGMFHIKSVNDTLRDAAMRPDPIPLWESMWYKGELCCLYSDSNLGKSILAVQIAKDIAEKMRVLYCDFELSDKQFQLRYTDLNGNCLEFPDDLYRVEINNEALDVVVNWEEDIVSNIENAVLQTGAEAVIVDNLTWICNNSEKGSDAGKLMMSLMTLKKKYDLSMLVIAHTPKRDSSMPITSNDLAGSRRLYNFFDSAFAIGQSAQDSNLRYVKQMKVRYGEYQYNADNVIVYSLEKDGAFLRFVKIGYASEKEHLKERSEEDMSALKEKVKLMHGDGYSIRAIAIELGVGKSTVSRWINE